MIYNVSRVVRNLIEHFRCRHLMFFVQKIFQCNNKHQEFTLEALKVNLVPRDM